MNATRGPRRFKADDARRALLEAGTELLDEHGVAPGLDRVRLEDAIERSGVPRTTAYRIFGGANGPLATFRAALLDELNPPLGADRTLDIVDAFLTDRSEELADADEAQLADALLEMIRLTINDRVTALTEVSSWRAYVSTLAATRHSDGDDLAPSVDLADRFVPLFEALGALFGIRPKPPLDWAGFANIMVAVADGSALRTLEDRSFGGIEMPIAAGSTTARNAGDRSWNGGAILTQSLFLVWCEPDPTATKTAALDRWTSFGT